MTVMVECTTYAHTYITSATACQTVSLTPLPFLIASLHQHTLTSLLELQAGHLERPRWQTTDMWRLLGAWSGMELVIASWLVPSNKYEHVTYRMSDICISHSLCMISQGHSLYQIWTLWDYSFLSYAADKQTERQTDKGEHLSQYPRRPTPSAWVSQWGNYLINEIIVFWGRTEIGIKMGITFS